MNELELEEWVVRANEQTGKWDILAVGEDGATCLIAAVDSETDARLIGASTLLFAAACRVIRARKAFAKQDVNNMISVTEEIMGADDDLQAAIKAAGGKI